MTAEVSPADVVVIGAGGHAKVVIELLRACSHRVVFCVASDGEQGATCLGVPVLVGDEHLRGLWEAGYRYAIVAIGNNSVRESLAKKAQEIGFVFVNAVSPASTVSPTARLGSGIAIMAGAVINADVRIRDNVIINTLASVDHDCVVDEYVHIAPNSTLAGNVRVSKRAFLGVGSLVLPGIAIGPDVRVGAGAVVTKDVQSGTVIGIPARPLLSTTIHE